MEGFSKIKIFGAAVVVVGTFLYVRIKIDDLVHTYVQDGLKIKWLNNHRNMALDCLRREQTSSKDVQICIAARHQLRAMKTYEDRLKVHCNRNWIVRLFEERPFISAYEFRDWVNFDMDTVALMEYKKAGLEPFDPSMLELELYKKWN